MCKTLNTDRIRSYVWASVKFHDQDNDRDIDNHKLPQFFRLDQ